MTESGKRGRRPPVDYSVIIERCAGGDQDALSELYLHEARVMRGIANGILGRREVAEDAVHDAFVQVWLHASTFDASRTTGKSWLMAVVRNRALTIRRATAREDLVANDPRAEEADGKLDAEAELILSEQKTRLRSCLKELEPRQRQILVLFSEAGISHSELAVRFGLPIGTVKSLIRRAYHRIRLCMRSIEMIVSSVLPSLCSIVDGFA